jgi:ubiquinone/menaquinone biosynthesis C-methylase UbiE
MVADHNAFSPKQRIIPTPETHSELCHPATCNVADVFLQDIIKDQDSSKPNAWIVHDNACGYGQVTRALLDVASSIPADSIEITGTDNSPAMIDAFRIKLKAHPALQGAVKISSEVQDSASLKFPNNHFTHSFTNFLVNSGPTGEQNQLILDEIYRTLQPGGTAVISNWSKLSFAEAIRKAHSETRGEGSSPLLMGMGDEMMKPEYLISLMEKSGFQTTKLTVLSKEVKAVMPLADEKAKERWLGLMWSVLGGTTGGWKREDEKHWDEALRTIERTLSSGSHSEADGRRLLPLHATIVIARK